MSTKKNIVWLASYPKSGNTWFRSFLSALLTKQELNLNKMYIRDVFSGKKLVEDILDTDSDSLTPQQIELYQRLTFQYLSDTSSNHLYVKIHDAFTFSAFDGLPLIPEEPTRLAIYLLRNPLDVTLSLANHLGRDYDSVIQNYINNPSGFFGNSFTTNNQFSQPLLTWSQHVESWKTYPTFKVHFIRYEDLKTNPFEVFKEAVQLIGLNHTDDEIRAAIEATSFEKLKKIEQEKGFREKLLPASTFFFKGETGRWKQELNTKQIQQIKKINEPMMREFGYWD